MSFTNQDYEDAQVMLAMAWLDLESERDILAATIDENRQAQHEYDLSIRAFERSRQNLAESSLRLRLAQEEI